MWRRFRVHHHLMKLLDLHGLGNRASGFKTLDISHLTTNISAKHMISNLKGLNLFSTPCITSKPSPAPPQSPGLFKSEDHHCSRLYEWCFAPPFSTLSDALHAPPALPPFSYLIYCFVFFWKERGSPTNKENSVCMSRMSILKRKR